MGYLWRGGEGGDWKGHGGGPGRLLIYFFCLGYSKKNVFIE